MIEIGPVVHEEHVARGLGYQPHPQAGVPSPPPAGGSGVAYPRQHHSEATDVLVAKAPRGAVDVLRMHYADCPLDFGCTVCDAHSFAIEDAQDALKALGK